MISRLVLTALCLAAAPAFAQSLTPEQLKALVDERVNQQNPYRELLNDPDPLRSMAALEIMLESEDPTLVRIAKEFGLLSSSSAVRAVVLKNYIATRPVLTLEFDGTDLEGTDVLNFKSNMRQRWSTLSKDMTGFFRIPVREFSEELNCHVDSRGRECGVTVNADGIFWQHPRGAGQLRLGEGGVLVGTSQISNVGVGIPTTARILE